MSSYINRYRQIDLSKRLKESTTMKLKHPHRCPLIVGKLDTDKSVPDIEKNKYLVPFDLTMAQFLYIIRKNIKLSHEQALFLFIDNQIVTPQSLIGSIHEEYKHDDGFLYVIYAGENTFGFRL